MRPLKVRLICQKLGQIASLTLALSCCLCLLAGCTGQKETHNEYPGPTAKTQKALLSTPLVFGNIGYDTKTGIINMPRNIVAVAFSPDSRYVACASRIEVMTEGADSHPGIVYTEHADDDMPLNILARRLVIIFDMATGVSKLQFITEAVVRSLAFSADSGMLFVGCDAHRLEDLGQDEAGYLQVWDVERGKLLRNVEKDVNLMTVAPTGHRLVLGMGGGYENHLSLAILDTTSWRTIHQFKPEVKVGILEDIAFSSDGRWFGALFFARESSIGEVWIWDTRSGKTLLHVVDSYETFSHPESSHAISPPLAMTVPGDKQAKGYIYCGNTRFKVKYAGETLKVIETSDVIKNRSDTVFAYANFNPKRAVSSDYFHAAAQDKPITYSLWDLNSQKVIKSWQLKAGYPNVEFSPDGKILAVVSAEDTYQLIKVP